MRIWIVTIYEPLPFGHVKTRPQRCGMLAKALIDRGHSVELWTSAFDHVFHKHYHKHSFREEVGNRISIQYIKGCGYRYDQSPKRFFHNRKTAGEFRQLAYMRKEAPDIIFAPVPILELAQAAVEYAKKMAIPAIVDIRDLWPDIYLTMLPRLLQPIGKKLLYPEYQRARFVFSNAAGITAVSEAYLCKGLSHARRKLRHTDKFFPLGTACTLNQHRTRSETLPDGNIQTYAISHNQFILTFVGSFSRFLDIQNILDAARLLADEQDIRIFVVGNGDRRKKYFEMANRLPNVTMTGWLHSEAIHAILKMTKVGLVTYSKDAIMSLPNKPFEYMAEGLPLLSSLRGELRDLIEKHRIGRFYEAGNPSSLADGVRWFYNHPEEARQMGKRSFELFSKKFKSDIVYKEFSEHLEGIAEHYGRNQK